MDASVLERPAWQARAACNGVDPDLFFPVKTTSNQDVERAQAVCRDCPVRDECLEYGLHLQDGIWGGLAAGARKKLRNRR